MRRRSSSRPSRRSSMRARITAAGVVSGAGVQQRGLNVVELQGDTWNDAHSNPLWKVAHGLLIRRPRDARSHCWLEVPRSVGCHLQ